MSLPYQFNTAILPVEAKVYGGVELVFGQAYEPLVKYKKYSYPSNFSIISEILLSNKTILFETCGVAVKASYEVISLL